jgi:hypothetical protein
MFGIIALVIVGCAAQDVDRTPAIPAPTAIEERLYPAELVMDHQEAIGLSEAQRNAIRSELENTQRELVDAEFDLRAQREALARTLSAPRVDETAAMEAAVRVADGERAIKLSYLRLLVRIKNQLTEQQQRSLDRLRRVSSSAAR